jgi:hypothetical protein
MGYLGLSAWAVRQGGYQCGFGGIAFSVNLVRLSRSAPQLPIELDDPLVLVAEVVD